MHLLFVFILLAYSVGTGAKTSSHAIIKYKAISYRIDSLYSESLRLSKQSKDSQYLDDEIYIKIRENIQLITKICSESFESQHYYDAQKENRSNTEYNYQFSQISTDLFNRRKENYRKCKSVEALLSRISFKFSKKYKGHAANAQIQNHQTQFENIKHIYKELVSIKLKLKDELMPLSSRKSVIQYYQNYKNFSCNFKNERALYTNAKIFLRAQLVAKKKKENNNRSLASKNNAFELTSLLEQLERRHLSFERFCLEIKNEKNFIDRKIKDLNI